MLLIIDSATEKSQVILADDEENFVVKRLPPGLQNSHLLVPYIAELGKLPEKILLTAGAGSYTGLRQGRAVALGLAFGKEIPIQEISSLYGFIPPEEGRFLSLIDARSGGVDVLLQERRGEEIFPLGEPERISLEELPTYLVGCKGIVGPNLDRFDLLSCYESYADAKRLVILGISCYTAHKKLKEIYELRESPYGRID